MKLPGGARVLWDREALAGVVARLGAEITRAYPGGVLLAGVLGSSIPFLADLLRAVHVPCELDLLGLSSYTSGSNRVQIVKDLDRDIQGRDVLLVEGLVDTGLTLSYLRGELLRRGPGTLGICTLFDRPTRRIVPVDLTFVGFEAPEDLLFGYGLGVQGRYQNLPFVAAGDWAILAVDPDAYVEALYGR